ncbi:asparagine synthetase B family protein [Aurantiacibacter gangjinensis]|uniref:asparagine synthase (glutamine-hydrolyzing) n=1 Tax=Aurantiacibacter gangjinensis TaxID=502682 RepID=A0A0G9MQ42_9SPHN|nr:asparagine synthase-related protein [Aurantiacibacter gangjinensis]APE27323.1 Asparagine synthetase glutamine-hydrolyzing [Aurantiacibacter gangjinensis]KLE31423.1 hypothetical protein AAW01_07455 [Aurantiacibacter gangjinensis]
MSGIAAIFHADGAPADMAALRRMVDAMAYRGPDGSEIAEHGCAALAHLALHIDPDDRTVSQPVASADGRHLLVLDGFLINGPELCRDLEELGVPLRGRSDAEIVVQGLATRGEEAVERLEGEFAFVWVDLAEQRVLCARDHYGLRPLTYHWDGPRLIVASDVAGVLAALDHTPRPNPGYLAEHIANAWYTRDETPWEGVKKLEPAHALTLARGDSSPALREYWRVPTQVDIRYRSDAEYAEHYRAMLDEVVRRCATSDQPVAFEVSGGLDSSAVFGLAHAAAQRGELAAPGMAGYALKGVPGDHSDERRYYRAVSEHTGRTINEIDLPATPLPAFIAQGIADGTLSFPPNTEMLGALLANARSNGSRICLTGQGGDIWLDGYERHYAESLRIGDYSGLGMGWNADRQSRGSAAATLRLLRYGLLPLAPEALKKGARRLRPIRRDPLSDHLWLSPRLREMLEKRKRRFEAQFDKIPYPAARKMRKMMNPHVGLSLEMLDLLAARLGMEYRHPMMSRCFVEFAARTPEHLRLRGTTRRYLHREAMRDVLPELVRIRRSKAIFDTTFLRLERDMETFCLDAAGNAPFSEWIDRAEMTALFDQCRGAAFDEQAIWELWGVFTAAAFSQVVRRESSAGD